MRANSIQGILGTRRLEPAPAQRPEQYGLGGRYAPAIEEHPEPENMLGRIHTSYTNNLAFRSVVKKSLSTSRKGFPTIEARATRIKSTG